MKVLFVCTANIVRSALAEHCFRRLVAERKIADVSVESAGLFALDGDPAAAPAVKVAQRRGVDLSGHRARAFDTALVAAEDLVVVMDELHRKQLLRATQLDPERIKLLAEFGASGGREISDPFGGPELAYEQCLDQLVQGLEGLASWLEEQRLGRS